VALSTEAKDDDEYREDSYTLPASLILPAAVSESSLMPLTMDHWSSANVNRLVRAS
jgi:hypothetical protein